MTAAEEFVRCADVDAKVRLLDSLSREQLEILARDVATCGSADDVALIGSYRDLQKTAPGGDGLRGGLKRSGSEVYWHRATGEQDFECAKAEPGGAAAPRTADASAGADYWDQVAEANTPGDVPPMPSPEDSADAAAAAPPGPRQASPLIGNAAARELPRQGSAFWDAMADNAAA
mmetsp:Transcript_7742/g.32025  ORF Transcript_7742/g.32025 Transcript_7742/m.32025 type:complete len:175 (+) Transcript_7742:100-624(+)